MEQIQPLYTAQEVRAILKCGKTKFYDLVKTPDFPKGVKIGERCTRWRADELNQWLNNQTQSKGA